ncbi:nucleotidyl transferase AbiEii/AbiGii toxin family protein [Thermodesulfobacterium thermophilum]|uniref:nucleotidyl transferase AbiEii/AbiGii toxin family protein n=1 Tax=Thermodesulfobacterium thermophilum TaxID=886 RepID=UPI00138AD722|nr:nucleotidyl transferase AbiEii/AbiGii toxin family protein [Thermodesulfobacterium thermophilum]
MIELASLEDILAMKTSAILQRGSKKDFVDVYFILKELKINCEQLIRIFQQKYGNFNPLIIKKVLTYFEDADKEGELKMIKKISWDKIKKYFIKEFVEV